MPKTIRNIDEEIEFYEKFTNKWFYTFIKKG